MIQLWHGGRRWDGKPEIKPPRKGRYECGPGIYLSTRYDRARKYAAGNGIATLVDLVDDISWVERKLMPLTVMEDYVRTTSGFRKRDVILADLSDCAERLGSDRLSASHLLNLCVNHEVLSGQQGVLLAEWLADQGVDASLYSVSRVEQWVIVFNPAIISSFRAVPAATVTLDQRELPKIQLPACA